MTITKQFQNEVAKKLTELFFRYIIEIKQSEEWMHYHDRYWRIQLRRDQYTEVSEILELNKMDLVCKSNSAKLFICQKLVELEVEKIREDNDFRNAIPFNLLECVSESSSRYYANDGNRIRIDIDQPIYSPIVDLAIVPTIKYRNSTKSLGIYSLCNGSHIFNLLDQISFTKRLSRNLRQYSTLNYERFGLNHANVEHNYRPLCLFAFEIENQVNKKHLVGDFINSLLLARHPIVLVPESKLDDCLKLVKLSEVISDIKRVNIYDILRRVMIISIPQFRQVIDGLLSERGINSLGVREFR